MIKLVLIKFIKFLHLAITVFLIIGWLLPGNITHWIHLVAVPLTMLQWRLNAGTCILTNVEEHLNDAPKEKDEQQGQFIKGLLGKCMTELPPDTVIKKYLYGILWVSWGLSGIRLYFNF